MRTDADASEPRGQSGHWMPLRLLLLVTALAPAAALCPAALPRAVVHASAPRLRSSPEALVMKGRKVGDGPAKSTRRSNKTPALQQMQAKITSQRKRRVKAENALTPALSIPEQGERFATFARGGAKISAVFARARADAVGSDGSTSDGEWLVVGDVCAAPGKAAADSLEAARLQRRLIYEHALTLYPVLAVHSRENIEIAAGDGESEPILVGSHAGSAGDDAHDATAPVAAVFASALTAAAAPAAAAFSDAPNTTRERRAVAEAMLLAATGVGFIGDALPSGIYRWVSSEGDSSGNGASRRPTHTIPTAPRNRNVPTTPYESYALVNGAARPSLSLRP